jgi:hypothetical protein
MSEHRDYGLVVMDGRPAGTSPAGYAPVDGSTDGFLPGIGARVPVVHRLGAMIIGAFILVFGMLGFAGGVDFLSTEGERVLGMSSNGLLSAISVVAAAVLIWAAITGPRIASTVMLVLGSLFLLSALGNMAVLQTSFNVLAFEMSNVIFSMVVGFVLVVLGAYGRIGGHLPPDSPYAHPHAEAERPDRSERGPSTPAESAAEHAMREAEIAVVQHVATPEQCRRVAAMAQEHTRQDRRRVWMNFDRTSI